jgi:Tol biopolymer transport system component
VKDSERISPDGKRLAYIALEGSQRFVVLDGKPGAKYEAVYKGTLTFSPDGKYLLYGAMTSGRPHMVVNGQPAPSFYDAI